MKVVRHMVMLSSALAPKGRAREGWTVQLSSECDFQNLFYSVVKPWLPGLGREEVAIVYDGQTKNADFNLMGSQIIVEMKHVKDTSTKAAIGKTLAGLADFYSKHSNVRVVLFFILVEASVRLADRKWEKDFSYTTQSPQVLTTVVRNPDA